METLSGIITSYSRRGKDHGKQNSGFGFIKAPDGNVYFFRKADVELGYEPQKNDLVEFAPNCQNARRVRHAESELGSE